MEGREARKRGGGRKIVEGQGGGMLKNQGQTTKLLGQGKRGIRRWRVRRRGEEVGIGRGGEMRGGEGGGMLAQKG